MKPNIPLEEGEFEIIREIIVFAYKVKFPHIKTSLMQGSEMYDLIAEYLGRKKSTRIYTQFFLGTPSISLQDFKTFCANIRKNLLSARVESKYPDVVEDCRKAIDYLEECIKTKPRDHLNLRNDKDIKETKKQASVENLISDNSKSDSDLLEIKSTMELFLGNMQNGEYDKAWNKISPNTKMRFSYDMLMPEFRAVFDPGTKDIFVSNLKKIKENVASCEIIFEQRVSNSISYSIFLNQITKTPLNVFTEDRAQKALDELSSHCKDLVALMDIPVRCKLKHPAVDRMLNILKTLKPTEEAEVELTVSEIFDAAMVNLSNIYFLLPLTTSCYVKMHAYVEFDYCDDRWHILLFTIRYINDHLSDCVINAYLVKPDPNSQQSDTLD